MRSVGHVVHMEDRGVAHRVLVGRLKGKRPLGRSRHRWDNNIKMEVGWGGLGSFDLAQDRDRCWMPVHAVMKLWVP